jgi:CheY-like chemotaxis protein
VCSDFAPQASTGSISLRLRASEVTVITDALLLERILRNLIANAVRYTREGGILVGTRRRGSNIRIDVIDTGVGIAPADQQRIFDEFVQLQGSAGRMRRGHGLGLGLAIVRRLGALLEHEITLASVPGRGSRFSVTLPRAVARRSRASRVEARDAKPEIASTSAQPFLDRRIVVIDDDSTVIAAMDALLSTWGARVVSAEDGEAAWRNLAAACAPHAVRADLIVADLRLAEGASGIDAVRTLRNNAGELIPAIIISGDTTEGARAEAAAAGIALLQKPVMAAALLSGAERALAAVHTAAADRAMSLVQETA